MIQLKNPDWRENDPALAARIAVIVGDLVDEAALRRELDNGEYRTSLIKPSLQRAPNDEDLDATPIDFAPIERVRGRLEEMKLKDWIRLIWVTDPAARMTAHHISYTVRAWIDHAGLEPRTKDSITSTVYLMCRQDEIKVVSEMASRNLVRSKQTERVYGIGDRFSDLFATRIGAGSKGKRQTGY